MCKFKTLNEHMRAFAGTHGDVLNVHTEGVSNLHTDGFMNARKSERSTTDRDLETKM